MVDAVGLVEGLYPGAAAQGLRNFPESTTSGPAHLRGLHAGTLTLARLGREAPIAAASPAGPACATSRPAASPRACCTRDAPAAEKLDAPVIGTDSPSSTSTGRARRNDRRSAMQTPAPFEYERATSVEGAIASLQRARRDARVIAGGHSLLPMMKLRLASPVAPRRHQRPRRAGLHPRGGRRDRDRHADPPRRPARVGPAGRALPGVPRRRGGHRRPGGAQPRHDRRLAVPGRRSRGPVRGAAQR